MDTLEISLAASILVFSVLTRLPFLKFPLDDDFSIYTYVARFAGRGFRWKKDLWLLGKPVWTELLLARLYGSPEQGVQQIRLLFAAFHALTSLVVFFGAITLGASPWAAWGGGMLYAFYGSSPDYTAGNYSQEQFFIPLILSGFLCLLQGSQYAVPAGFLFGLAVLPKFTTGIYAVAFAPLVGWFHGLPAMGYFSAAASAPVVLSFLIDWKLGYWDEEARKQYKTRWAVGVRLIQTKKTYHGYAREILEIVGRTLPVWIVGLPSLIFSFAEAGGVLWGVFAFITVGMIGVQRGFSRYHYQPSIALLCLAGGWGLSQLHSIDDFVTLITLSVFSASVLVNLYYMAPFFLRPLDVKNLARCEKFDQYIYLPHLAKILQRRMRINGESDRRIYIWGTFTQLYHLTGHPASDPFLHHGVGPWDSPVSEPYFDAVVGGLIRHKPVYLIKAFHDLNVAALEDATGLKYQLVKSALLRFPVYRLVSSESRAPDPLALPWREKAQILNRLTQFEEAPGVEKTDCEGKPIPGINKVDIKAGRLKPALKEARKLCRLNPYDVQGLYQLGKLYDALDRADEAEETFNRLLTLKPGHHGARLFLAKHRLEKNQLDEAERLIREEIRRMGENASTHFYLGRLARARDNHGEAVRHFEKTRALAPDWADAGYWLAESHEALGDTESARGEYENMYRQVGNRFDADYLRAKAQLALARLEAPQRPESETLTLALREFPKNEIIAYARASALEREGKTGEAEKYFREGAERFKLKNLRAACSFRLARLVSSNEKKTLLESCLKLDPLHEGAKKMLENICRSGDDPRQGSFSRQDSAQ